MGIATTPTKLPLATWAKMLGLHPLHFEGIDYVAPGDAPQRLCRTPLPQYPWFNADRTSREDIARAIADAEALIETQLKWRLQPTWEFNEWNADPQRRNYSLVKAQWSKAIQAGVEAKTLIASAPIVWSDVNTDGYKETGTVTVTVAAGQSACEVEAYYPGHSGEDTFQIRPITCTIVGTTATIKFRRELCVLEDLLFGLSQDVVDLNDDGDFLSTVDVYRHYNDASQQGSIVWSSPVCGTCNGSGCTACSLTEQTICLRLLSPSGAWEYQPATWDVATSSYLIGQYLGRGYPNGVKVNYQAGLPRVRCAMDPVWARTVAYLSVALLDRPLCDCTADTWALWREDLAVVNGGEQGKTFGGGVQDRASKSRFGTRRGAVYAWDRVTDADVAAVRSTTMV